MSKFEIGLSKYLLTYRKYCKISYLLNMFFHLHLKFNGLSDDVYISKLLT